MRVVTAEDLDRILTFPALIEALRDGFRAGVVAPDRHHHTIVSPDAPAATLLLMPAWHDPANGHGDRRLLGVKVVAVHPGNAARGKGSVNGTYLLMDGATGEQLAVIDGLALTLWRTAAASALAASYLARKNSSRLVMIGAGNLAPFLIKAHASVRPIDEVLIWNRNPERAEKLAASQTNGRYSISATTDLETASRSADIVSCATLSREPLVRGAWLKPGAHLDLVGAFTPEMRESDDEAIVHASVFVDTREGALAEAGDIVQPLRAGLISESSIRGDLFDLCRGKIAGRQSEQEITLFKSVGTALEDLAAAALVFSLATWV
jgi:ornithine cyclodeaminase/alanine dehydrogenase-like protein (mu-crystallin family)